MIHYVGVFDAMKELHMDYMPHTINQLCCRDSSGIRVVCFQKALVLLSFAWKFSVFVKEVNSGIFLATWSDTMKRAMHNNPDLSIDNLESEVWVPTFLHCQLLLEKLQNLSITLGEVDEELYSYKNWELQVQLELLHDGVSKCDKLNLSASWIDNAVKKITEYRALCNHHEVATHFLKLRELLQLKGGDFTDVEQISSKVIIIGVRHILQFCLLCRFHLQCMTKH